MMSWDVPDEDWWLYRFHFTADEGDDPPDGTDTDEAIASSAVDAHDRSHAESTASFLNQNFIRNSPIDTGLTELRADSLDLKVPVCALSTMSPQRDVTLAGIDGAVKISVGVPVPQLYKTSAGRASPEIPANGFNLNDLYQKRVYYSDKDSRRLENTLGTQVVPVSLDEFRGRTLTSRDKRTRHVVMPKGVPVSKYEFLRSNAIPVNQSFVSSKEYIAPRSSSVKPLAPTTLDILGSLPKTVSVPKISPVNASSDPITGVASTAHSSTQLVGWRGKEPSAKPVRPLEEKVLPSATAPIPTPQLKVPARFKSAQTDPTKEVFISKERRIIQSSTEALTKEVFSNVDDAVLQVAERKLKIDQSQSSLSAPASAAGLGQTRQLQVPDKFKSLVQPAPVMKKKDTAQSDQSSVPASKAGVFDTRDAAQIKHDSELQHVLDTSFEESQS